jgi:hypothetical protein
MSQAAEARSRSPLLIAADLQARLVVMNHLPAAVVRVWVDPDAEALAVAVHPLWQDRLEDMPVPATFAGFRVDQRLWQTENAT